ncbi:acyl carrier protein [Angelakisella massiliensis]|nr:acyl carrier protein [Angelakisella massiliensis]
MSTFESIVKVISDYREMDPEEITLSTTFEDLALDSLDMTEILMGLEDEFGITIEPDEKLENVEQLVTFIDDQLEKNA